MVRRQQRPCGAAKGRVRFPSLTCIRAFWSRVRVAAVSTSSGGTHLTISPPSDTLSTCRQSSTFDMSAPAPVRPPSTSTVHTAASAGGALILRKPAALCGRLVGLVLGFLVALKSALVDDCGGAGRAQVGERQAHTYIEVEAA